MVPAEVLRFVLHRNESAIIFKIDGLETNQVCGFKLRNSRLLDSQDIETDVIEEAVDDTRSQPEFFPLDPRQIRLEQIGGLIFTAFVAVGMLIGGVIVLINVGLGLASYAVMAGGLAVFALLMYFSIFWPSKAYHRTSWRLDEEGLEIRRGVLWRHRISIPLGRVQHADVSQGPLQRYFELGTLTVHTAGTQGASVALEGLTHSVALDLRDRLVRQRKGSDVV